jgi:hypothetical protein
VIIVSALIPLVWFKVIGWFQASVRNQGNRANLVERQGGREIGLCAHIDGEELDGMIGTRDEVRRDFVALVTKRLAAGLVRRPRPSASRRRRSAAAPAGGAHSARREERGDWILFNESLAEEGAVVFSKARELGLEGIVSKRAGSLHLSGPSHSWLKTKTAAKSTMPEQNGSSLRNMKRLKGAGVKSRRPPLSCES